MCIKTTLTTIIASTVKNLFLESKGVSFEIRTISSAYAGGRDGYMIYVWNNYATVCGYLILDNTLTSDRSNIILSYNCLNIADRQKIGNSVIFYISSWLHSLIRNAIWN